MNPVRLLIVDDHAMVLAGLAALLPERSGGEFEVVATTTEATEAARLAVEHEPELALVDLRMPEPGGVAAVRAIRDALPSCRIIAVSGDASRALIVEAVIAGAVAFLPKTLQVEDMLPPLRTVLGGGSVLPPGILHDFATNWVRQVSQSSAPPLDDGDRQLLRLLVSGKETSSIADELYVSPSTVKRYLAALEERLGATSRVEAAFLAGWYRLVDPTVARDPEA